MLCDKVQTKTYKIKTFMYSERTDSTVKELSQSIGLLFNR